MQFAVRLPRLAALSLLVLGPWPAACGETIRYALLNRDRIEDRLRSGLVKNRERELQLRNLFSVAGCQEHLSEQAVRHVRLPNVICEMTGADDRMIIAGAHFDFVDSGAGIVDNWSGASLLPSLYESLRTVRRRHTFVFIGFADEEKGLVGSRYYVDKLGKDRLRKISAMVNLDSLGTSTTRVELDRGDKRLVDALNIVASSFTLPLGLVNIHRVGYSDSDSFQNQKVPAINIHSLTQETFHLLHTKKDQIGAIHRDEYYDTYRLVTCYLAYLDAVLDPPAPPM